MDREFVLACNSGVGYKVSITELVDIYNSLFDKTESGEWLEIIINHFSLLKDFVTQKCGGALVDFDYLEDNTYLTTDEALEYIKTNYTSIDDLYCAMGNIKEPTAHMFELVELADGTFEVWNIDANQIDCIDNIVSCFCNFMVNAEYV